MPDFAHFETLNRVFTALLSDLSTTWPAEDVACVEEMVGHREYGDALENLIAAGRQNGEGFNSGQVRTIEALAASMEMTNSPFLVELRQPAA